MELYGSDTPYTTDKEILKNFDSKQNQIIQTNENGEHTYKNDKTYWLNIRMYGLSCKSK